MEVLKPIQYKALVLLAAGREGKQVAAETGVSQKTICEWKKQPNFKQMLKEAVSHSFDSAIAELVSGSQEAAKELKNIIVDEDTPTRVKVSAITTLLQFASKAKDSILEEKLELLEDKIDGFNET